MNAQAHVRENNSNQSVSLVQLIGADVRENNSNVDQSVSLLQLMGADDSADDYLNLGIQLPFLFDGDRWLNVVDPRYGGFESSFGNLTLQPQPQINASGSFDQYPLPDLGVAPSPMPMPARNHPSKNSITYLITADLILVSSK